MLWGLLTGSLPCRVATAFALALIGGCKGGSPVHYSALVGSNVPLDSMLTQVAHVPLEDGGTHPIGRIGGVTLTPWGEIVVADDAMREVKVFDGNGRLRGLLGRAGSGPGEFALPLAATMNEAGDGVIVTDLMQPRYVVFYRDSVRRAPATVQYLVPGLMVNKVIPWQSDSMLLVGTQNRFKGDSVYDAALATSSGALARMEFRRPPEFDGQRLVVNVGAAYASRAGSSVFFGSSIWGGILRRNMVNQAEDTLHLPPSAFTSVVFPDSALNGRTGLSNFVKATPLIADFVAADDSTLFVTVAVWDVGSEAMRFKILRIHWGTVQTVSETPFGTARLRGRLGDTLFATRGEVGDTVWVDKFIRRHAGP